MVGCHSSCPWAGVRKQEIAWGQTPDGYRAASPEPAFWDTFIMNQKKTTYCDNQKKSQSQTHTPDYRNVSFSHAFVPRWNSQLNRRWSV